MVKMKMGSKQKTPSPEAPDANNPKAVNDARRGFLSWLWTFLGLTALVEMIWLVIAFFKPRRRAAANADIASRIPAGRIDQFQLNTVTAFPRGRFYLARLADGGFVALSRQCTHLGCTVPWDSEKRQFLCPCHASVFDIQGRVIQSPAMRPLDRFAITIENQTIWVDTAQAIRQTANPQTAIVYPETHQPLN